MPRNRKPAPLPAAPPDVLACTCRDRYDLADVHPKFRAQLRARWDALHTGGGHEPADPKSAGSWRDLDEAAAEALGRGPAPVDLPTTDDVLEGRTSGRGYTRRRASIVQRASTTRCAHAC